MAEIFSWPMAVILGKMQYPKNSRRLFHIHAMLNGVSMQSKHALWQIVPCIQHPCNALRMLSGKTGGGMPMLHAYMLL